MANLQGNGQDVNGMHEQLPNSKFPQHSRSLLAHKHAVGSENKQPSQHATIQPQHAIIGIKQRPAKVNPFTSLFSDLSSAAHNAADHEGAFTMKGAQLQGAAAAPNKMFDKSVTANAPRRPLAPLHDNGQQPDASAGNGQQQMAKDMLHIASAGQQKHPNAISGDSLLGLTAASSKYPMRLNAAKQFNTAAAAAAACKDQIEQVQQNIPAPPAGVMQHWQDTQHPAGLLASYLLSSKPLTGHCVPKNIFGTQHPARASEQRPHTHKLAAHDAADQVQRNRQYLAGKQPPAGTSASSSTSASFTTGWLEHDHASFQPLTNHLSKTKDYPAGDQQKALAPQASDQLAAGTSAVVNYLVPGCSREDSVPYSPACHASSNLASSSGSKGNSSYYSFSDSDDGDSDDQKYDNCQQKSMHEPWHVLQLKATQRIRPAAARAPDITATEHVSGHGAAAVACTMHTEAHVAGTAAPAVAQQLAHAQRMQKVHHQKSTRVSHSILEGADSWPATQSRRSRNLGLVSALQHATTDVTSQRGSSVRTPADPAATAGPERGLMQTFNAHIDSSALAAGESSKQQSSLKASSHPPINVPISPSVAAATGSHAKSDLTWGAGLAADSFSVLPAPVTISADVHPSLGDQQKEQSCSEQQTSMQHAFANLQEAADSHSSCSNSSTTGLRLMKPTQLPLIPLHLLSKEAQHSQGQHQGLAASWQTDQIGPTSAPAINIAAPGSQAKHETHGSLVQQLTTQTTSILEEDVHGPASRHPSTSSNAALPASDKVHLQQQLVGEYFQRLRLQGGHSVSDTSATHTIMRPPVGMPALVAESTQSTAGHAEDVSNKLLHSYLEQYRRHQQWQAAQLSMFQGIHAAVCGPAAPSSTGAALQQQIKLACQPAAGTTASASVGIAAHSMDAHQSLDLTAIAGHHFNPPAAVVPAATAAQNTLMGGSAAVIPDDEVLRTRQQFQLRLLQHSQQMASQITHPRHGIAADSNSANAVSRQLAGSGNGCVGASRCSSSHLRSMPLPLGITHGPSMLHPAQHYLVQPYLHPVNVNQAPAAAEACIYLPGNTIKHSTSCVDQLTYSIQSGAALGTADAVARAPSDAAAATSPPLVADVAADAPSSAASAVTADSISDTAQSLLRHELLDCSPFVGLAEHDIDYMRYVGVHSILMRLVAEPGWPQLQHQEESCNEQESCNQGLFSICLQSVNKASQGISCVETHCCDLTLQ
jgi:hypothetical protein